jgi:hypothetical protein
MNRGDPAIQFLLNSADPSIRPFTLVDLLGKSKRAREVKPARERFTLNTLRVLKAAGRA